MKAHLRRHVFHCGLLLIVGLTVLLAGCASHQPQITTLSNEPTLRELQALNQNTVAPVTTQKNKIRTMALREAAMSVGARSGFAARYKQINQLLEQKAGYLDHIFDFRGLMLKDNVLPPVIVEGRATFNMANTQSIRLADRSYQIIRQAQFVTVAPTWREYLEVQYQKPELPDRSLLPKNKEEQAEWRRLVAEAWQQGMQQASLTYTENLNRLKRDYTGMMLYKTLLTKRMVSAPEVAKRNFGVTGGGNSLSVNDRSMTITAEPSLNPDSKNWEPVL